MSAPHCTRCSKGLIPRATWDKMDAASKSNAREYGMTVTGGRGLCKSCHWGLGQKGLLHTAGPSARMTPQQIADRTEDLWWMANSGECLAGAARRLDISERALERWLTSHNLIDLRTKLTANNPRDHNRVRDDAAVTEVSGERAYRRRAREQQGSAA